MAGNFRGSGIEAACLFTLKLNSVVLSFNWQNPGEIASRSIEQRVPIVHTVCHLGGRRAWFCCTARSGGKFCLRRVAVLYSFGGSFACRRCHGLAYASQQESPRFRRISRARKIRTSLGGSPNLFDNFPAKPPRMHWRTYDRLRARGETADATAFAYF